MVKNDLIDRYIYAVTKHMKSAMKKDVAAELETIIQDMLEERCEDVTPTERDIKVVLTELGTPNELASKYKGETQIVIKDMPLDERKNRVAKVAAEEIFLLDFIGSWINFKFKEKK